MPLSYDLKKPWLSVAEISLSCIERLLNFAPLQPVKTGMEEKRIGKALPRWQSRVMTSRERFLAACRCEGVDRPPVWLMRQAGRCLPEFRAARENHSFAEIVRDPELAAAVTLQPVTRYGFDAAIVFSDIMAAPEAMGIRYELREGEGIVLERAVETIEDIRMLESDERVVREKLDYLDETIKLVRGRLDETALLGFAGSPWTLACYLAEGGGAKGGAFTKALALADREPNAFRLLMEKLTDTVAASLKLQIEAGADAVQIFDSWASACPAAHYEKLSLEWIRAVIAKLPRETPVVVFAKARSDHAGLAASGARVISVDHHANLREIADKLPRDVAVQGNLDPALLEGEPANVRDATKTLLESMRGRPGHIVNLGHGVTPAARLDAIAALVETVREF